MDYNNKIMNKVKEQMKKDASLPPTVNCVMNEEQIDDNTLSYYDLVSDECKEMFDLEEGTIMELFMKNEFLLTHPKTLTFDCVCGSGVSFGKCHRALMIDMKRVSDNIQARYNKPNQITTKRANYVPYVRSFTKLPTELCEQLNDYLLKEKIGWRACWFNSHKLASVMEDVEVVNGWYGWKYPKKYRKELIKAWNKKVKLNQRYVYGNMSALGLSVHKSILDLEELIVWCKHSWNKYGDIHFDLTCESMRDFWKELRDRSSEMGEDWFQNLPYEYGDCKQFIHYMELETFDIDYVARNASENWSKEDTYNLADGIVNSEEQFFNTNPYYEDSEYDFNEHIDNIIISCQNGNPIL